MLDATVVIATKNRARVLEATLAHLARLDTTGLSWELVAVDNGSTDDTQAVLHAAAASLPMRVLTQPIPGKNRSLNTALPQARGSLIVFTDDDVEPVTGWLRALVSAHRRWTDYDVFAGPIHPAYPPRTPAWLKQHPFAAIAYARFSGPAVESPLGDSSPYGPNVAIRATRLAGEQFNERIGAQREGQADYPLGDETELLQRLRRQGARTVFVPDASVMHRVEDHQLSHDWLFMRSFRAGRGEVCLAPDVTAPRVFGAPRYLWRMIAAATAAAAVQRFRGARARFDAGIRLHYIRGVLHEYRKAHQPGS